MSARQMSLVSTKIDFALPPIPWGQLSSSRVKLPRFYAAHPIERVTNPNGRSLEINLDLIQIMMTQQR